MIRRYLIILIYFKINITLSAFCQEIDWRNAENGTSIYSNGYCDQPYVIILSDGKWFCTFTTGEGKEGAGGQYIACTSSENQGKSWSKPVRIEAPGQESASWAMPYVTNFGRIYVFYDYNGDKIHSLGEKKNIREDMLGWYCYRYSDDGGNSWSKRYRLDVRKTKIDYTNNWNGDVQLLWGIGKPVNVDNGMMFAFAKIGHYMLENSEGWFFRCNNINSERSADKLQFKMVPEGEVGVKNEDYGPVNEEQNILQLKNGTLYSVHRTISGNPLESYSLNGGKSWSKPAPPVYETGIALKTPRACPRIWKCKNGKYLFWYHNNGGKSFEDRNPAWISGGTEKDGKILWSQPEILFYEADIQKRMSYPDLIEQNGRYWITETNKTAARCHEVPAEFLISLWQQFGINKITTENLIRSYDSTDLKINSPILFESRNINIFDRGITFDLKLELATGNPQQVILELKGDNGKSFKLQKGQYGDIEVIINDGKVMSQWNSDPGLLPVYGKHNVTVTIDNGPKIIQFIVDGIVCNGNQSRQFGWSRFTADMKDFHARSLIIGNLGKRDENVIGKLYQLRIYSRAILNTEAIGNQRNDIITANEQVNHNQKN